ncbi:restriction endonuclease subunit S [Microcystis aeruginosa]|uniref:Type I restriction enzyme EcoKI specificity protein n=1 Tax=Microcystis aeruginosa SPC777 TaxID=482300 RepID=S3JBI0_MICAE|nr:restriction endonuclease subunit S [Microcystis aeruginosa]EPF21916.1 Type I restriction enzyme EcoKI specificity protein [Microcystis aeruginosa SPC777]
MSKNMIQWLEIGDLDIHISDGNYSSKYPRSEEFIESGVPFIRANNLVNKSISDEEMYFISPQKHGLLKKGHLKTNDVLISTRGDLGKVALVPKRYNDSNINAQLVLLRPNPHKIDPLYLLYCFEGDRVKGQISQLQTGTALKQLPVGNLKRIKIPLPPLEEQRRIAAILDKADGVRRKRKEAIRLTEELLKSTFLEMFGDPVTNPKGWEICELQNVCNRVTDGTHQPPNWADEGIPFLFVSNIVNGEIDFKVSKHITEESWFELTSRCPIEINDILYTTVGSYGNAALVRTKNRFCFQRHIAHIKPDSRSIEPEFLLGMMQSDWIRQQADKQARGVAQKTLNLRELKKFTIFTPPIEEQKKYVKLRQGVETQLSYYRSALEQSENLFNSLLQRAFRGEL